MSERTKHILIAGSGSMLPHLTMRFHSQGHRITLVLSDAREAEELSRSLKATVFCGDATDPDFLAEIWTESVDLVLALTARDYDNLGICRFAHEHFQVPRVFAIASNPAIVPLFSTLGVEAFSPTLVVAQMIEEHSVADSGKID